MNHFAAVCRSTNAQDDKQPRTQHHRQRSDARTKTATGAIRAIAPETATSTENVSTIDEDEYAEFLRFKRNKEYGIYSIEIGALKVSDDRIRAHVTIQGVQATCIVDSGSPINVIDESAYLKMYSRPQLTACNTKYFGFGSKAPLPILG